MFGKAYNAIGSVFQKVFNPIARGVSKTAQVYNQLPPEAQAVVSGKAEDVARGVRTDYPPAVRKFLENGGAEIPVHSLEIVIEPLAPVVETLANKMTANLASHYAHARGFDGFFHVALIVNGKYAIEKHKEGIYVGTEVPRGKMNPKVRVVRKHINLTHRSAGTASPGSDEVRPALVDIDGEFHEPGVWFNTTPYYQQPPTTRATDRLTIGSMLEKTHKMMGDPAFFSYDLFKNNCAIFVETVLRANGLLSEDARRFVAQDIEGLARQMPGWTNTVAKSFTNLTNLVSIAQTGR
jgi:hypothetical protein